MLTFEEAQKRIRETIRPLGEETVQLNTALGRVLAKPVVSAIDLPVFDNSAMDGYALRAESVQKASAAQPVSLQLSGQTAAGEVFSGEVKPGNCIRLFTGSPLPRGADAVVMQEDTRIDPAQPGTVLILDSIKPWENIRLRGEDVKRGETLAQAGMRLTVGRLSLLAATGFTQIDVGRQPIVGLLATGNELIEGGQPLAPGQIYESNRTVLAALLLKCSATPRIYPLVKDTLAATRTALEQALTECDAVVTSGGASVGELDFVKQAFQAMGGELSFWKVAIKPGKPFLFGRWREKLLFGLPGNPISAFVTFLLLVRPALLGMQGAVQLDLPAHPGTLLEPLVNHGERRHFVRVIVDSGGNVRSAGVQASHILSSFAEANGLVDVPPESTLAAGAMVKVLRWE